MSDPSPALIRIAKWLLILLCAALVAGSVTLGSPEEPSWWALLPFLIAWQAAPAALAAICVRASAGRVGQVLFLLLEILFLAVTASVYAEVLTSSSSTAAIGLVVAPLYLSTAFLLVIFVAALCGWRARASWLRD